MPWPRCWRWKAKASCCAASSPTLRRWRKRAPARDVAEPEWCERRLLARISRYTIRTLRAQVEPVASADFMRFLLEWQGVTREPKGEGPQSLAAVLEQLEGFEIPAIAWERDVLPARLQAYDPGWLDTLCLSGRVLWARLDAPKGSVAGPVRTTPIALLSRAHFPLWRGFSHRQHGEATLSSLGAGHRRAAQPRVAPRSSTN